MEALCSALGTVFPRYGPHRKRSKESSEDFQKSESMRINWMNRHVWARKDSAGDVQQTLYSWKPAAEQEGKVCSPWLWLISLKGEGFSCTKENWAVKTLHMVRVVKVLKDLLGDTVTSLSKTFFKNSLNNLSETRFPTAQYWGSKID